MTTGAIAADLARGRATETDRERSEQDAGDVRCLRRYLATGRHRDFVALHRRLATTVHVASVRALMSDERRRGRAFVPDLMQEVWLHLVADDARILRAFDPERGALRSYVGRIAYNRARDGLRRPCLGDAAHDTADLEDHHLAMPGHAKRLEDRDILAKLLAAIGARSSGRFGQVVQTAFFEEADAAQTAEATGLTHQYVLKCKSQIRKLARQWRERHEREG